MIRKRLGQLRYVKNPLQIWRLLFSRVKSIEIAVNYVCNKKCPGCYARNLRADQEKMFLTPKDIKEICEKYKPAHINITGGEPMLNPKLFEIIQTIPKSIIVSMVTNGDLFKNPPDVIDFETEIDYIKLWNLKSSGLNTIQISYGSNYNCIWNKELAKYSKREGLNVCLSVTNVYKERKHILQAIRIAEENGYHVLFNTPGVGMEDQFDYQTYFTYRSHPLVREDNMFWNGADVCPAGLKKFYISADKSIYPCDRLHDEKYSSYKEMRKQYKGLKKVYCRRYCKMVEND